MGRRCACNAEIGVRFPAGPRRVCCPWRRLVTLPDCLSVLGEFDPRQGRVSFGPVVQQQDVPLARERYGCDSRLVHFCTRGRVARPAVATRITAVRFRPSAPAISRTSSPRGGTVLTKRPCRVQSPGSGPPCLRAQMRLGSPKPDEVVRLHSVAPHSKAKSLSM
jgi:hypothetical protein